MVCLPKAFLLDQLLVVLTVELYNNTELWSVTCSDGGGCLYYDSPNLNHEILS